MDSAVYEGTMKRITVHGGNDLVHSSLKRYEGGTARSQVYSIKYVVEGKERYRLDGRTIDVSAGQYLLVNPGRSFECSFKSNMTVHGFCVGIDPTLVDAVFHAMMNDEERLLNDPFGTSSFTGLHEMVFTSSNELGSFIQRILPLSQTGDYISMQPSYDLFYDLASKLLCTHQRTTTLLDRLSSKRSATRKELYERLELAREIIDANTHRTLQVAEIAHRSALSEFHFYRSFKALYQVSPHQYHLQKRLSRSAELLKDGSMNITDIAYQCGFADIYSFSKAFKKHYGAAPSTLKMVQTCDR